MGFVQAEKAATLATGLGPFLPAFSLCPVTSLFFENLSGAVREDAPRCPRRRRRRKSELGAVAVFSLSSLARSRASLAQLPSSNHRSCSPFHLFRSSTFRLFVKVFTSLVSFKRQLLSCFRTFPPLFSLRLVESSPHLPSFIHVTPLHRRCEVSYPLVRHHYS